MPDDSKAPKKHAAAKPKHFHVSYKEREYFTENLAMLLKAAVPVGEALASLESTATTAPMKKALRAMQQDIEAGYSLADTLKRSGVVGQQTLALIYLGEKSGRLVENMHVAAIQEEKRHVFQAKVRSALIYPAFVMSMTLIVGIGVAWFLLPKLSGTFSQLQVELPLISRLMINFGIFLKEHGVIVVPAFLLASVVLVYIMFFAPKTKVIGQRILMATPGVGRLMREVEVAQFGALLSTLLNAGLPIVQAITLLASASNSVQYRKFYEFLAESLNDGYSMRDSLGRYKHSAKLLPAAVQQMVIAGEKSGSLSDVLEDVGRTYEQKSDITTQNLEVIMEPILLVVIWLGVMLVAVAIIVPVYSLVGGLGAP